MKKTKTKYIFNEYRAKNNDCMNLDEHEIIFLKLLELEEKINQLLPGKVNLTKELKELES